MRLAVGALAVDPRSERPTAVSEPFLFVRMNWDRTAPRLRLDLMRCLDLHYGPEPGWPFGRRGAAMESAWKHQAPPNAAGMLILDGDVIIDPHDYIQMVASVQLIPEAVHVAPVRLWPVSNTDSDRWVWAHWRDGNKTNEYVEQEPDFFCFNFTFLPRRLLELCTKAGLKQWVFPSVDTRVSRVCRDAGIPVRVVPDCFPKHMHF